MTTEHSTDSSCASENPVDKTEAMKTVTDLLSQGKRSMVCGEIPKAVNFYEEAVQLLVKSCGELSRDCADAYFCCGSALLELGRMETNVLGVALEGVEVEEEKDVESSEQFEKPPEDDGEERHKLREDVYEAMAEGDREEEFKKYSQEKTGVTCVANCNTSTEVTGMETDKAEVAVEKSEGEKHGDSLADNGGEKSSTITGCKKDEPTDSVDMTEDNKTVSSDKEQSITATREESQQDNTAEVTEKEKSDKPASLDNKLEEIQDDSRKATQEHGCNTADGKDSIDNKQQEHLDKSTKENPVATTADSQGEKTNTSAKTASEKKEHMDASEEQISSVTGDSRGEKVNESKTDDSAAHKKTAIEDSLCADITSQAGSDKVTENATSKQDIAGGQQSSDHVANTVGDVEKEKCAEHIVTEAVKEAHQKIADEETNGTAVADVGTGATDKVVSDVGGVEADENADVEMADDDEAMDEGDDDAVNAETDIAENEDNGDEKAEDVANFQLAWEYLELAKVIYLKSESADDQLKAAECHIKLGELSMETEQYSTAAGDLENALQIQQKHLPANDRLIAETHYQLGLATGLDGKYEQSIQHYTTAISVLESKIESLSQLVKEKEVNGENKENADVGELKQYQDEIKELQDLIPEIKNKVEDMRLEAREVEQVKQMTKEAMGFPGAANAQETASVTLTSKVDIVNASGDSVEHGQQQASDIGHLVRKKRKPDTDFTDEAQEVKKIRPDNSGDCSSEATVVNQEPVNEALQLDVVNSVPATVINQKPVSEASQLDVVNNVPAIVVNQEPICEASQLIVANSVPATDVNQEPVRDASQLDVVNNVPTTDVNQKPISEASQLDVDNSVPTTDVNQKPVSEASQLDVVNSVPATVAKLRPDDKTTAEPVLGESKMSTVTELSPLQPITEETEVAVANEASNIEPISGNSEASAVSKISEPGPADAEPAVGEPSVLEPVTGESAINTVGETSKHEVVNGESKVNIISETKNEPVGGECEVDMVNESSKIEPVNGESETDMISESSKIEPVNGGLEADMVSEPSKIEPVNGGLEADMVSEPSKIEPVNGESEAEMISEPSKIEPVNGGSEADMISEPSKIEPVNGGSEAEMISEPSKIEPVNGESESDTVSKSSKIEPVNGDSEMDIVNESSKHEPVNGGSEASKQVSVDVADVDTVKGESKLQTIVVKESCSINSRDEVAMETESTVS